MPREVEPEDDLPPTEWARARRRDHDATAGARSGMRTGLAKQFKQVLDAQVKRARRAVRPADAVEPDDGPDDVDESERRPERHDHRPRHSGG